MSGVVASQVISNSPSLVLLVWLHGFKGGDDTFESFPERLTFLLTETWPHTQCTSIIYPAYDTRGSLSKASEVFLDWLTVKTTEYETAHATTSQGKSKTDVGREQAYVILLGHSMGGLVIADATLKLIRERDSQTNLQDSIIWPGIIGLIGYDTPYYGLNPTFFTNTANEYLGHAKTAQQVMNNLGLGLAFGMGAAGSSSANGPTAAQKKDKSSPEPHKKDQEQKATTQPTNAASNWMKLGLAAVGVAGLAAAAGTTYWQKDKITENVGWAASHLDYVKELFETDRLNQRMTDIIKLQPVMNFHCFYTEIPKVDPNSSDRHFIILPSSKTQPRGIDASFSVNQNQKAANEINAHTTMFNQNLNSGYWDLGKDSARLISNWLQESHQHRSQLNRNLDDHVLNQSSKFTQDPTNRDQLAGDAKVKLDDEVGDQQLRDEL
ncbi:hypothetical protein PGT21_025230 [Puccinia graminis f. sp. tritici]|uniref:DUF676 domain-containing protein n=2 Tax=Puccinia graminis f. sp. tritici TaxID=56615 RepID=E3K2F2_PUCGT|nr:uncharacterized protein PGTG_04477 [Puccinia graminis f. sp. tritici CRL 75-36-700-3]EFP78521.1 hypothetical protein PGTG_04477 [Puccinia graminis f. sp. tritici CRL 75-36-700-3]KAA1119424.1 hypothetical protein PGT21_025230 [Puccinia graminis f. sp. tritici]